MADEGVAVTAEPKGEMTLLTAIQQVLKKALIDDQLVRGAREAVKALDRDEALLCLLAQDCDEPAYTRLIEALCKKQKVHLIRVPEKQQLGEWVGQCKIDQDGVATKVRSCTCAIVKTFDEDSEALAFITEHIRSGGGADAAGAADGGDDNE